MEWREVERRLERAFASEPRLYGETRVVERRRPSRLAHLMEKMLTAQEREDLGGGLAWWPGNLQQLLEWHEVLRVSLLVFGWDGCLGSSAGLELVGNGRARWLCYWQTDDPDSYLTVARVEPWDDEVAVSATVSRLLSRNGKRFGFEVFGSLPYTTVNFAPKLVFGTTIKQVYWDSEDWVEYGWSDMALEERCLIGDDTGIGPFPDDWEDHTRQRIFDAWFESAYQEV